MLRNDVLWTLVRFETARSSRFQLVLPSNRKSPTELAQGGLIIKPKGVAR